MKRKIVLIVAAVAIFVVGIVVGARWTGMAIDKVEERLTIAIEGKTDIAKTAILAAAMADMTEDSAKIEVLEELLTDYMRWLAEDDEGVQE